ncbi:hypothetical protein FHETE_4919 [Fusarium heterosporum]|uniref:Uncharacterized protein n=1 Tax=Fusarium heterosporum TaxID=42747 RepID=A0A8H5TE07_FUSHE|nr:hypothetical protein FHETE_4919 [Fusarium heterosporum]
MSDYDPFINLGLTCPYEGLFYICSNDPIRFIGCCSINPCGARKGLCPDQHLKPASFDKAHQGVVPPQACVNDNVDVAWFTCPGTFPPFIGCCAVDPCARGSCPRRELRAAKLGDKTKDVDEVLGGGSRYIPEFPSTSSDPIIFDPVTSIGGEPTAAVSTTVTNFVTFYTQQTTLGTSTPTSKPDSGHNEGSPGSSKKLAIALPIVLILLLLLIIFLLHRFHNKTRGRINRWRDSRKTKGSKNDPETTQDNDPQEEGPSAPPVPNQEGSASNGLRLPQAGKEAEDVFHVRHHESAFKPYTLSNTQARVLSRIKGTE